MSTTTETTPTSQERKPRAPLPAPNGDFYEFAETLPADELALVKKVRAYMETKAQPIINKYWVEDAFPFELLRSFKELGLAAHGKDRVLRADRAAGGLGCRPWPVDDRDAPG